MFLSFVAKNRMMRVLSAVKSGILSEQEIQERSRLSNSSVRGALSSLERVGFVVSGTLLPSDIKIYRATRLGIEAIETKMEL